MATSLSVAEKARAEAKALKKEWLMAKRARERGENAQNKPFEHSIGPPSTPATMGGSKRKLEPKESEESNKKAKKEKKTKKQKKAKNEKSDRAESMKQDKIVVTDVEESSVKVEKKAKNAAKGPAEDNDSTESNRVFVGRLPKEATERQIKGFFVGQLGCDEFDVLKVTNKWGHVPISGKYKGIALVTFVSSSLAVQASSLSGSVLGGSQLHIAVHTQVSMLRILYCIVWAYFDL